MRIAATSDRHQLPGASRAVRCRTLFVLSRYRVLLTPPAGSSTPSGTSPVVTRRHSAISSLRQCHDHRRLARAARPLGRRAIPARQRTVFLKHQEAPRQLDQPTSCPRIASLGQALLSAFQTALVGRSLEPGVARHRSSISKLPRQDLPHQHVRRLDADTDHPGEQPHHRMRPCIRCPLEPLGTQGGAEADTGKEGRTARDRPSSPGCGT